MSLAENVLHHIHAERAARFKRLHLPEEFIAPHYEGYSIANLAASVIQVLGGRPPRTPLAPELLDRLTDGVRRVVWVIVDALGYERLLAALEANPHNGLHHLLHHGGRLAPLTSVFPSTTTSALTSLWCGYTPAEHGSLGFQLFLRGFNLRANMINLNATALQKIGGEQLVGAGLEPEKFLAVPSLPQALARVGVPTYNLIEQPYEKSPLSRVQIRGVRETRGFVTSSDMWVALRSWMEQVVGEKALFVAYWSAVDTIAHTYGPSSETVLAEVNNFAYSLEREFLRPLSAAARAHTLFLLTADHGHVNSPQDHAVYLHDHPDLRERLLMDYAGEPRAAYLYCVQGEVESVRAYFEKRLADKFFVLDSQLALALGLFGNGAPAPEARYRVGDLTVLGRSNYYLWEKREPPRPLGRHGGLSEAEMLVPLLAARLDG
jgi:hypothetical protein